MNARLAVALLAVVVAGGSGCEPMPAPPARHHAFGPGVDLGSSGRKVVLADTDGQVWGKLRVSRRTWRVYGSAAQRIGTVTHDVDGTWRVRDVGSSARCEGRADGPDRVRWTCGDARFTSTRTDDGATVTDAAGGTWTVATVGEVASLRAGPAHTPGTPVAESTDAGLRVWTHRDATASYVASPPLGVPGLARHGLDRVGLALLAFDAPVLDADADRLLGAAFAFAHRRTPAALAAEGSAE